MFSTPQGSHRCLSHVNRLSECSSEGRCLWQLLKPQESCCSTLLGGFNLECLCASCKEEGMYQPTNLTAFCIIHSLQPVRHVAPLAKTLPDHSDACSLLESSRVGKGQSQATSVISIQTLKAQLPVGPPEVFGKGSAFPCSALLNSGEPCDMIMLI